MQYAHDYIGRMDSLRAINQTGEGNAGVDNELYQPRPVISRRRTIYWRTADSSANGPSRAPQADNAL